MTSTFLLLAPPTFAACEPPPAAEPVASLLQHLPECQRNAAWLADLGARLNAEGQYSQALDHLERAVLLDPALKSAQIDYAIALAGSGDAASALQLLQALLAEPTLPPALRASLQRQLAEWRAPPTPLLQTRLSAMARLGHDSNLLGAPNLGSLALTLPGQTVVLQLDDGYRSRPGSYLRGDLTWEARRAAADGSRWEALANLRSRVSPTVGASDVDQALLALERSQAPAADRPGHYAGLSLSQLSSRGGTRYATQSLSLGLQAQAPVLSLFGNDPNPVCSARAGLELQNRNFQSSPVLSGRYTGLAALWACQSPAGISWQLSGRLGQDQARQPSRPGGDQAQYSLRGLASGPAPRWGARWLLDVELARNADANIYSPLLESGRSRRIDRINARAELQRPLTPGLQAMAGLEWTRQSASLPLFRLDSWGSYVALRAAW